MKTISFLSPTSLHLFESDRDEFYLKYLSDNARPDQVQTDAMAVGSAFDAYVKANLYYDLFGPSDEYSVDTLMKTQVDEECIEFAHRAGGYAFDCYEKCGCYRELLDELRKSTEPPRFEFKLTGAIGNIPLVGKPDCWYKKNIQVTLDWKVEGFCSNHPQSPKKFYKSCRDTWGEEVAKPTRGGGEPKPHKGYVEIDHYGHKIGSHWLEDVNTRWADQIAIYSWLLGMEVGDEDTVTCIDQLACKPGDPNPLIRVAQHRCRISEKYQRGLFARLEACWQALTTNHIFTDMEKDESIARCELLDMPTGEPDEFWAMVNERQYRG